METTETMYGLAALCIVLGFIALLKQKTYLDSNTNKPVSINVPFFGNMKTNFPSLVFLFVGAVLAAIPWFKTPPDAGKEQWVITGSLRAPKGVVVNWREGTLVPLPKVFDPEMKPTGEFVINYPVPKGKRIEEFISAINYTNGNVSKTIRTADEYQKFLHKKQSLVEEAGKNSLSYKVVDVDVYPPLVQNRGEIQ